MKTKPKLPEHCEFCHSTSIKYSDTYPDYWFCIKCKNGNELKINYSETKVLPMNDYTVEQPDPFTIIKRDKNGNIIDIVHWDI
jgi:hypothetical protein